MLYDSYRKRMIKVAGILNTVKRFRVLIILACVFLAALTATLMSVRGIVYDKSSCPSSIIYGESLGYSAKAVMGDVRYEYALKNSDEWTEIEPIRAGEYKVRSYSKDILGKPRYGKTHAFAILPKEITVSAAATTVYGDNPQVTAALSFEDSITCTKFDYDDFTKTATDVTPVKSAVTVTDKYGADVTSSYIINTLTTPITFTQRQITVTAASDEKIYDGTALLSSEFSADNLISGHILYATTYGEQTNAGVGANRITEGSVKITTADGTDVTHNYGVKLADGALSVAKRPLGVKTPDGNWEYDANIHGLNEYTVSGLLSGHTERATAFAEIRNAGSEANSLTISVYDADNNNVSSNYQINYDFGELSVSKRAITVTSNSGSWEYDGAAHLQIGHTSSGLVSGHHSAIITATSITDAGSMENTVTAAVYDERGLVVTNNYDITYICGTLKVTQRPVTITAASSEKPYDGTPLTSDGILSQGLVSGHKVTADTVGSITDVGNTINTVSTGSVVIASGGNDVTGNYLITLKSGTLTVTRCALTVTAASDTKVYDGAPLTSDLYSADIPGDHKIAARTQGSRTDAGTGVNSVIYGSVSIFNASGRNVTGYYELYYADGELKVAPRPVVIATDGKQWVYDGDNHSHTKHGVSDNSKYGIVSGHTTQAVAFTEILNKGKKDNELVIKVYDGARDVTSNYAITYEYGSLEITPRPITATADDGEKFYDGTPLTCTTVTVTSAYTPALVKEHNVTVTQSSSLTDAGKTANRIAAAVVTAPGGKDVTANYSMTFADGVLTVKKRPVTIETHSNSWVYDGTAHSDGGHNISAIVGMGLAQGQTSKSRNGATITDVGTVSNTMIAEVFAGGKNVTANYEINYSFGTLEVTQRPVTITAESGSKEYDGTPLILTGIRSQNLVEGHVATGISQGSQTEIGESANKVVAGSVVIKFGNTDVTRNYKITFEDGLLKVLPRKITVLAGSSEKVYDGDPLTCANYYDSNKKLLSGHKLTATTAGSQTDVGTSDNIVVAGSVVITDAQNTDVTNYYEITLEKGTLKVTPRPITVLAGSATKVYDGKPLTCETYSDKDGKLVKDHVLTATTEGSQTEVGTSDNIIVEGSVQITSGERDVTSNYTVTLEKGKLEVTVRKITVNTADTTVYYGYEIDSGYTSSITVGGDGIADGQTAEYNAQTHEGVRNVGEYKNVVFATIFDGETDVTKNYRITYNYGKLIVAPRPVTFTATTSGFYTGEEFVRENVTLSCTSELKLLPGHKAKGTVRSSQTELGKGVLKIDKDSVVISDNDKIIYTENYDISVEDGEIQIVQRYLMIRSKDATKVYDGEPLVCHEYESIKENNDNFGVVKGHTFSADITYTGSQTDIGESYNTYEHANAKVTDKNGNDVTGYYRLFFTHGTLKVMVPEGSITITTGSASKNYDGTPLTCNEYTLENTLPDNYTVEFEVTGSITKPGTALNGGKLTVTVDGKDVTEYVNVERNYGTLTVYGDEGGSGGGDSGGGGGLDSSGTIGSGGGSGDGEAGEPTVALKVYSEISGPVYLRYKSYGNYNGTRWLEAGSYTNLIDGKYSANYITSIALANAGYSPYSMQLIQYYPNYMLPYYTALGEYDYDIQSSDIWYTGDTSAIYSLAYYNYDFVTSGKIAANLGAYSNYETAYAQFVRSNYLTVNENTRAAIAKVIMQQGFDISDPAVIAKVASYVQNCAKYNLDYDKTLDSQPDIVTAFLEVYKEGTCSHYASAATLIYRQLGIPARFVTGYAAVTEANNWVEVSSSQAHAWVEVYLDGFGWVQVEVTGNGGGGTIGGGNTGSEGGSGGGLNDGEPVKTLLILQPADEAKAYDGTPLTATKLKTNVTLNALKERGYSWQVTFGGSQTEIGVGESSITSFTLYDENGNDVTDNTAFEYSFEKGKLTVVEQLVTLYLYTYKKEYDGTQLSYSGSAYYYVEGLPQGYTITADFSGVGRVDKGTVSGTDFNQVPIAVYDENGKDVTSRFHISFKGELVVNPRSLTVTATSASKKYDGTELTSDKWYISAGSLAEGHRAEVTVKGGVTDVGTAVNEVIAIKIYDADGNDVTANYFIETLSGRLEVKPE